MRADRSIRSLLRRRLAPAFERRTIVLGPEQTRAYDGAAWRGALVVVAQGRIELEAIDGSRYAFGRGEIIWLERLPLRALHNRDAQPVVLVALFRPSAG